MIFQNCLKFQLPKKARREITYNNFEISLVVLIPNITINHAITYTNSASNEILMILWLYRSILEWFYLTRERGSSIAKCETDVQLGMSGVAYQTEMLEGKTPMSHCETLMSHRKQQCWIIKLKCRHGEQQCWITKLKCRMVKNRVKS